MLTVSNNTTHGQLKN